MSYIIFIIEFIVQWERQIEIKKLILQSYFNDFISSYVYNCGLCKNVVGLWSEGVGFQGLGQVLWRFDFQLVLGV